MDVVYWAHATATGGGRNDGHSKTDDGKLDVTLSVPKEMGGPGGDGTNPEQLFATGYSACYLGAVRAAAGKEHVKVSDDANVTAHVGFGDNPNGTGFLIDVKLDVSLPGIDPEKAKEITEKAHHICPYSNATRGNINVETKLV